MLLLLLHYWRPTTTDFSYSVWELVLEELNFGDFSFSFNSGEIKMELDHDWMHKRNNPTRVGMMEEFVDGVTQFINHAKTLDDFLSFQVIQHPCENVIVWLVKQKRLS